VSPVRRDPFPVLVVALDDVPPEGLELPLNVGPRALAALVTEGEEEPPAFVSALTGALRLRRLGVRLEVRGSFRVEATLACDRCLAPTSAVLAGEIEEGLMLSSSGGGEPEGDEALAVTDGRVDLAGLLAESFWLAWPYRFICRPDCAGLCPTCGADLNRGACGCRREPG